MINNAAAIQENDAAIDHLADRVNAITAWDGIDPDEYDNSGNGVLDVLHREFHEYVEHGNVIKEIKFEDGNLIIIYESVYGERTVIIPLSEIIVLDDYYTKEEIDAKIDAIISDISGVTEDIESLREALEAIGAKVEENTEKIAIVSGAVNNEQARAEAIEAEISGNVATNTTDIASLFEKLGYDDNETLVTTNPREVAFGEYNVSNTGENDEDKTVFSIGNGTSDENRSNAVEVRKDGTVYMWVEGQFMNINDLLAMLAHETY